jgi:hypothetical protein
MIKSKSRMKRTCIILLAQRTQSVPDMASTIALPPGWEERVDPKTGRPFFVKYEWGLHACPFVVFHSHFR